MSETQDLQMEVAALADAAEVDPAAASDLKALAVQLWTNFNDFSLEELEDVLRDEWRTRGLPFNDNASL